MLIKSLLILGGASAVSLSIFSNYSALQNQKATMENQNNAGMALSILKKEVSRINNSAEWYVPAGNNTLKEYTTLPAYFDNNRLGANRVPFLYCPVSGGSTGGGGQVNNPDGTSYSIAVTANPARSGKDYVTSSSYGHTDALAFIVSAQGNKREIPNCNDIQKINGVYTVEDGQVFPLTMADVLATQSSKAVEDVVVTANHTNNSIETGDEVVSKSLTTNLERFKNNTVRELIVYLEDGVYNLPVDTMVSDSIKGKKLTFVGNGIVEINTNNVDLKGVDLVLDNVELNSNVAINSSYLNIDNSLIQDLSVIDGKVSATNIEAGNVTATGSSISIRENFDIGRMDMLAGSEVNFVDGNGFAGNTSLGIGISGAKVSISNTVITLTGSTGINNQGELVTWNSDIKSTGGNYGILSSNGAINRLNGDLFINGTQPTYSFFDSGSTGLVAGNGGFAGSCFNGSIFNPLETITTLDGTTYDIPNPNNQQGWSC